MPMVWSGQASLACPQPAINKSSAEAVLDGDGRDDERSGARPDLSAARRKRTGVRARDGWATPNVRVRRGQREAARVGLGNAFGPWRCAARGKGEAGCCLGLGQRPKREGNRGKEGFSRIFGEDELFARIFYELVVPTSVCSLEIVKRAAWPDPGTVRKLGWSVEARGLISLSKLGPLRT